jgi:type I restriction enzyme, S subunit
VTQQSQFPLISLRDAHVALLDCEHATPSPTDGGFPYLAIPNIRDGRLDLTGVRRISRADLERWTRKTKPIEGDVVMTRRGRVGDTAAVPANLECAIGQNLVILRSDGTRVDQGYLRWALRGPMHDEQVRKHLNVGAVFDSLNCRDIPNFAIPLPPLHIQREISTVLSTMDRQIEINERINRTAMALVGTLFRQMVDSRTLAETREIDQLATIVGGSTPSTTNPDYWDSGTIPWATPKDLSRTEFPVLLDTERHITEHGAQQISSGVLPVGTVLLSSRAPIGYLAVAETPTAVNQGFIAMIPDRGVSRHFLLRWAEYAMEDIKARANGTTFQEISKRNFRSMMVPMPDQRAIEAFDVLAESIHRLMVANLRQNRVTSELRDLLLPKLISGEKRIKDVESEVESTV